MVSKRFWEGVLGQAHKVMTINDPFEEMPTMMTNLHAMTSVTNIWTISRSIEFLHESGGDLDREDPESDNNQHNSLRRVRRRRKENVQLTSRLSQTPSGTIYYRMTEPAGKKGSRMKPSRSNCLPKVWKSSVGGVASRP